MQVESVVWGQKERGWKRCGPRPQLPSLPPFQLQGSLLRGFCCFMETEFPRFLLRTRNAASNLLLPTGRRVREIPAMKQECRFGGFLSSSKRVSDIPVKNQVYRFEYLPAYRETKFMRSCSEPGT